jgi:hypothetical protein
MHTYVAEVLTRALHIPAPSPQELCFAALHCPYHDSLTVAFHLLSVALLFHETGFA